MLRLSPYIVKSNTVSENISLRMTVNPQFCGAFFVAIQICYKLPGRGTLSQQSSYIRVRDADNALELPTPPKTNSAPPAEAKPLRYLGSGASVSPEDSRTHRLSTVSKRSRSFKYPATIASGISGCYLGAWERIAAADESFPSKLYSKRVSGTQFR